METEPSRADWDESKIKREKNGRFGTKPKSEKGKKKTKLLTNPKKTSTINTSLKGTVTSKGVEIKHVRKHASDNMKKRKITEKRAINTLTKPDRVRPDKDHGLKEGYKYEKGTIRVIVDHADGAIVTVMITKDKSGGSQ